MSCFLGRMKEYDRVSLDRFDGQNLQSTVYFLSHIHTDHTIGLGTDTFFCRLQSNADIFVYCSEVTEILLLGSQQHRRLKPYIKCLPINTPTQIEIPGPPHVSNECVTVTLLPAFHCPGSVMFLLDGKEGIVLYTGDFRWEHFNIQQMSHLHLGNGVKKIKSLYVDTTFFSEAARMCNRTFPSRLQCIEAVTELVREWTGMSPRHDVYMKLPAKYGHEPLLVDVAKQLNTKVHVSRQKYEVYSSIREFADYFTTDGRSTQIHACDRDGQVDEDADIVEFCKDQHDPDKILEVRPSTMYFTRYDITLDKIVKKMGDNLYRACYSFHSSYSEVADLLAYLKPDAAYASVKAHTDDCLDRTQARLKSLLELCQCPRGTEDPGWQNVYTREPAGTQPALERGVYTREPAGTQPALERGRSWDGGSFLAAVNHHSEDDDIIIIESDTE